MTKIEVFQGTSTVTKDWIFACIRNPSSREEACMTGAGRNSTEAIGNMIETYPEFFGIQWKSREDWDSEIKLSQAAREGRALVALELHRRGYLTSNQTAGICEQELIGEDFKAEG